MAGDRLLHHGEVVGPGDGPDAEAAVLGFIRRAIGKMDQTGDRQRAGDVGDVKALDMIRQLFQFQCVLQIDNGSGSRRGIRQFRIFKGTDLPGIKRFDVGGNIPVERRFLKLLLFSDFFHFQFQDIPHFFDIAVQNGNEFVDPRLIFLLRDFTLAGTAAIPDRSGKTMLPVLQARFRHFAGAQFQVMDQKFRCHFQGAALGKRSEVETGIVLFEARHFEARELFGGVDLEHQVAFIVPHQDIEVGGVLLDEMSLQHQGFILVPNRDKFPGLDGVDERAQFGVGTVFPGRLKILAHAAAQVRCLAHIDHLAEDVTVNVTARLRGDVPGIKIVPFQAHSAPLSNILRSISSAFAAARSRICSRLRPRRNSKTSVTPSQTIPQ